MGKVTNRHFTHKFADRKPYEPFYNKRIEAMFMTELVQSPRHSVLSFLRLE